MRWHLTPTQQEYNASYVVSEQLRHERLFEQGLKISLLESTPLGDPTPRKSMAKHREDQLQQQAKSILDVMGNEPDSIPGL